MNYAVTRYIYRPLSLPIAKVLARTSVTPLQVTFASALLALVAAGLFATDAYFAAAIVVFAAEVTDCVDGDLARFTASSSNIGAFVDSVLDRWMDAAVLVGIAYSAPGRLWAPVLFALVGSFLVSYTRARAQGLGTDCPEGIGGRDTRALLVVIGGLTGQIAIALIAIGVVSFITAVQRFILSVRSLQAAERRAPSLERTGASETAASE